MIKNVRNCKALGVLVELCKRDMLSRHVGHIENPNFTEGFADIKDYRPEASSALYINLMALASENDRLSGGKSGALDI